MSSLACGLLSSAVVLVCASFALAQEMPKPGPEHQKLKELEGNWDATIKAEGSESKGSTTYKMDLGGMWLASDFSGEMAGMKFSGKGMDGYDPVAKKYNAVWVDSMSSRPVVLEGNYSADGKTLTMTGEGPGPDGKPAKYRTTSLYPDKDTIVWTLFSPGPDGKEMQMLSITYKRRK